LFSWHFFSSFFPKKELLEKKLEQVFIDQMSLLSSNQQSVKALKETQSTDFNLKIHPLALSPNGFW